MREDVHIRVMYSMIREQTQKSYLEVLKAYSVAQKKVGRPIDYTKTRYKNSTLSCRISTRQAGEPRKMIRKDKQGRQNS